MLSPLEAEFILARKHELKDVNGRMIPGTKYPMFPGGQFGGSIAEIRELIKRQKRSTGAAYTTIAGGRISVQIPVSATARMLLGYRVTHNLNGDVGTLIVNDEEVVSNVICSLHNPFVVRFQSEYIPIPRPLSGQDQIIYNVQAITASLGHVEIFYL